jgi:preprotein translocase SecA subunit
MLKWLKSLVGDNNELVVSRLQKVVKQINDLEPRFAALSDGELAAQTTAFRQRLDQGEDLDDLLPEAFATVREASRRTIGLRHYDVQLIGGMVLHQGKIAEMKTGEGKTLVATLALYLNALPGEGVHLVTVNDYLARRDAGWMGPIFHLLGLKVGFIAHEYSALFDPEYVDPTVSLDDERLVHWRPCTRQEAYRADMTYGTNNEFGFDYLRDNMVQSLGQAVQREHVFAIVDEVDNILIDEARTPLIISGPAAKSSDQYARFARLVNDLRAGSVTPDEVKKGAEPNGDVLLDPKSRSVLLTEQGLAKIESRLEELGPDESVYDPQHATLTHYLENALKARFIFHRDKDYIVSKEGEVVIVDEFTGRLMPGRRWSDGLHQAVEAKEGVDVRRETVTYATITFQNYFRMYQKLAGMTGTALTEKEEFGKIYNLEVVVIPTNKPTARKDLTDQIYRSEEAKFGAVVREIQERQQQGQPVLVGTTSVETSERLSQLLRREKIPHQVLNAKQNQEEARVVAQAGQPGTVTIATNMAGRGTDILLGGNAEALAARYLEEVGVTREELVELARRLEAADKEQRDEPLRMLIERSNGRLDERLLAALRALRTQYEEAMRRIDDSSEGEALFLLRSALEDVEATFEQKFELVRSVLRGDLTRARKLVREVPDLSEEKIAELQRMHSDYMAYHNSGRDRPLFLAGLLFDKVYAARASLVQHTLRGELEAARQIVAETPGLREAFVEDVQRIQRECGEHALRIREAGGLHVIGTERHEARRIDNQLRGRAGRQGDPGSSRFYLSLEDELMRRFGRMDTIKSVMSRLGVEDEVPIEAGLINRSIEGAQARVEGYNFDIRKHTVEYDNVMNKQREAIYARRRRILEEAHEVQRIEELIGRYIEPAAYAEWLGDEVRDELEATRALPEDVTRQRLARLLPDSELDLPALRQAAAAADQSLAELLAPIIAQQQERRLPARLLVEQLAEFIELPEDAEAQLRDADRHEAERYANEIWRDQNEGDIEERVKELFAEEFDGLIARYTDEYDDWMRGQIGEAVADATNPATDEVNPRMVQRRLGSILPEVAEYDPVELGELSPQELLQELEGLIGPSRERGHNIDLLSGEIASLLPLMPSLQIRSNMSAAEWARTLDRYQEQYRERVELITAALDDEERARVVDEAMAFVRQQIQPFYAPTGPIGSDQINARFAATYTHGAELLHAMLGQLGNDEMADMLASLVDKAFDDWRDVVGVKELGSYQRALMLRTIDLEWQQYLTAMDDLRQGIGLQAVGQRDPLIMYQTEGYRMFGELLANINRTVVQSFFRQLPEHQRYIQQARDEQFQRDAAAKAGYESGRARVAAKSEGAAGPPAAQPLQRAAPKVGRNDPCPCGSGKKYKQCHGRADGAPPPAQQPRAAVVVRQDPAEEQRVAALAAEIKAATGGAAPANATGGATPRGRSVPADAKKPAGAGANKKKGRR